MTASQILDSSILNVMNKIPSDVNMYLVGGAVRDYFMNTPCNDYDFTVTAKSYDEMLNVLLDAGFNVFLETPQYFTIRAQFPECVKTYKNKMLTADFVLSRKDGIYKDNRHPEKVEMGTIIDDLRRRDFTMNAIAIDVRTNEIIDPFGGYNDIKYNKIIKCVGKYTDRLEEDALRILRAIRFFIKFKLIMNLDSPLRNLIFNYKPFTRKYVLTEQENNIINNLKDISIERILTELTKMFEDDTKIAVNVLSWTDDKIQEIMYGKDSPIWFMPTTKKK